MKDCEYWQERMSLLLDGELPPEEETALWEHMGQCPDCQRAFETYARMTGILRCELAEPPASLQGLVMARIDAQGDGQEDAAPKKSATVRRLRPWRKVAAAACFVALVAVGAVTGVFSRGRTPAGGGDLPESAEAVYPNAMPSAGGENAVYAAPTQAPDAPRQASADTASEIKTASIPDAGTGAASQQAPDAEPVEEPASLPETDAASLPETDADAPPEADEESAPEPVTDADLETTPEPDAPADGFGVMRAAEPPLVVEDVEEDAADNNNDDGSGDSAALPVRDGAGQPVGHIGDSAAFLALLTGEPWQGEQPQAAYAVTANGGEYYLAGDGDGRLLWWQSGGDVTLSPAALAAFTALIEQ